jgi:hypothetical protein
MKENLLSPEQAFRAMFVFLNAFYQRTEGKAELGEVLGDIQINSNNGSPMDPAAWGDWLAAVAAVFDESKAEENK